MAKQKQKWTSEEEEALSAGVEKQTILTDSQFASSLANHLNVDLKDWCNLSGSDHGSADSKKVPTTVCISGVMIYDDLSVVLIFEDPNGTDINPKNISAQQLRRLFAASLKKPELKGNLKKVDIYYKFIGASSGAETSQHEDVEANHVNNWFQRFLLHCICSCCSWKFEAGDHKSLEKGE